MVDVRTNFTFVKLKFVTPEVPAKFCPTYDLIVNKSKYDYLNCILYQRVEFKCTVRFCTDMLIGYNYEPHIVKMSSEVRKMACKSLTDLLFLI